MSARQSDPKAPLRREPPQFRLVAVDRIAPLTPRMTRVVLAGPELDGLAIDEPASLAAFAYLAVSQPTASELSGPPRRLGNNGSSGLPQLSRSHTRSVSTV